jgi:hypothetical protein
MIQNNSIRAVTVYRPEVQASILERGMDSLVSPSRPDRLCVPSRLFLKGQRDRISLHLVPRLSMYGYTSSPPHYDFMARNFEHKDNFTVSLQAFPTIYLRMFNSVHF